MQNRYSAVNSSRCNQATPLRDKLSGYERVVATLSAHYFAAVRDDLEALALELGPERVFVLAVGVRPEEVPTALRTCLLPIDVRVERVVSGPRTTLNSRALVWLLEEIVPSSGWSRDAVEAEIESRLSNAAISNKGDAVIAKRRMSDEEVAAWIHEQRATMPQLGCTLLLQRLRASGCSCEQSRFSRLFKALEYPALAKQGRLDWEL